MLRSRGFYLQYIHDYTFLHCICIFLISIFQWLVHMIWIVWMPWSTYLIKSSWLGALFDFNSFIISLNSSYVDFLYDLSALSAFAITSSLFSHLLTASVVINSSLKCSFHYFFLKLTVILLFHQIEKRCIVCSFPCIYFLE